MQLITLASIYCAFVLGASAAPLEDTSSIEARQDRCVSPYPATRTSTGRGRKQALLFRISQGDDNTDAQTLRLRPIGPGVSAVVVDDTSPALGYKMRDGVLYQQTDISGYTRSRDAGPVGGLRNVSSTADGGRQAFIFRNGTVDADAAFKQSIDQWSLTAFGEGEYGLYKNVGIGFANGFQLCQRDGYKQLFYYESKTGDGGLPAGCQPVGVVNTVAPVLPVD